MKISLTNYTKTFKGILKHNYQKYIAFVALNKFGFWESYKLQYFFTYIYNTKKNPIAIIHRANIFAKVFFCCSSESYYQRKKLNQWSEWKSLGTVIVNKTLRTYFSSFKCTAQNQFAMTLRISLTHHITTKEIGGENKLKWIFKSLFCLPKISGYFELWHF